MTYDPDLDPTCEHCGERLYFHVYDSQTRESFCRTRSGTFIEATPHDPDDDQPEQGGIRRW